MLFIDNLNAYHRLLTRRNQLIRKQLTSLPKGTMFTKKTGKYLYHYVYCDGEEKRIHKQEKLIQQYEKKKLLEQQLKVIEHNLDAIEKLKKRYKLLSPEALGIPENQLVQGLPWEHVKGQQNTYWTDQRELLYKGIHYHSKSEMLIAILLTNLGIEFKYEVTLQIGHRRLYPDFVIRRPRDGKIFYLEHAGMTSREDYVISLHERLDEYHTAGINLWDNLIVTFDREDGSIDMDYIERVLRMYLL